MENNSKIWIWFGIVFELGFLIAIPIVVLILLGRWLDMKFGTGVFFLVSGVVLALVSTTVLIARRVKQMTKRLE